MYCEKNYYGDACMTYCEAKDNALDGFYKCSENGTKACLENYHGRECKAYCKPSDSESGHYSCGPNGQMICLQGTVTISLFYICVCTLLWQDVQ